MHDMEIEDSFSKALVQSRGGKQHFGRVWDRRQPQWDFEEPRDEVQILCFFLLLKEFEDGPPQGLNTLF